MAFLPDGRMVGSLSSGCIEEALALEARNAADEGRVRKVRYGRGSPWIDIRLPCGAGLDITLWPTAGEPVLHEAAAAMAARQARALVLPEAGLGEARLAPIDFAQWTEGGFVLPRAPGLKFRVFGTGIETATFAKLASGAGYDVAVSTTDDWALRALPPELMVKGSAFEACDEQTAAVLFFHDHEKESEILKSLLATECFWIGAQGSRRALNIRLETLAAEGIAQDQLDRIQGRIGLIPSARDPQTLSVSVLADVVAAYKQDWFDPLFGANAGAVRP